jgi:hypothetical protein
MKKVILLAIVFSGVMTSCFKKDRTCECTVTSGNKITVRTITLTKSTKSDAKSACESGSVTFTSGTSTSTSKGDCKLK